ncbi:hypothetical protein NM208_g14461 [Fusarium decemcellulare]|uniref:Uncharacterized protein n=1 Tax=Fusarium decemcellulare TaxID=57161 RepID=A0ACC1RFY5_9HYPO|nr:hypothetical protein NM208_g14461 [Fusarium decemcellulare]
MPEGPWALQACEAVEFVSGTSPIEQAFRQQQQQQHVAWLLGVVASPSRLSPTSMTPTLDRLWKSEIASTNSMRLLKTSALCVPLCDSSFNCDLHLDECIPSQALQAIQPDSRSLSLAPLPLALLFSTPLLVLPKLPRSILSR